MIDNKRIAKNTLFLYVRMLLIMGVTLYTSRVVLRVLGVDDFGLYNVVGGIVTMFTFLNGSLAAATSRFITFELGRKDYVALNKIFNVALVTHIFIAIIIVILAETIGLWFLYEKMNIPSERLNASIWVYQISIITCVCSLTTVPYNAVIIAHEEMQIYAYVGIVEALAKLGVAFLIMISPIDKLIFYASLIMFVQISIMAFYRIYCRKYDETELKICKEQRLYKNMFSYAGSDIIGQLSGLAQGQGLNILLNLFFGPAVNAARGIAYQVQGAVTQFANNFYTAVRPQIIKSYAEGNIKGMMRLVKDSSWFSYYLMLMISLPICLEANFILQIWLGDYPEKAPIFLILVMILCLIQTLKTPRTTVLHATGHILLANVVVGLLLCSAFPLASLFLKWGYPPESVFWAANLTMFVSEFVSVFVVKKYVDYSISDYLRNVHLRCFIVSLLSCVLLYFLRSTLDAGWGRLVIMCCMSVCVVGLWAYVLGIDNVMRSKIIAVVKNKMNTIWKR